MSGNPMFNRTMEIVILDANLMNKLSHSNDELNVIGNMPQTTALTNKGNDLDPLPSIESTVEIQNFQVLYTQKAEPSLILFFQVLFPFIIAGFGMVLAGIVLNIVQHWPLFIEVPEIFILVPALLGLKGNLEMTLASRLSTLANTGKMDTRQQIKSVVLSNIALIQTQAIIVTFFASAVAIILSWIPHGRINLTHASLLCASSLVTASLASFVLSGIMVLVIILSKKFRINPDNVATPIAASLGDLTTLSILAFFGSIFLKAHVRESWLNNFVIILFLFLIPFWVTFAKHDECSYQVLREGWSPIIFSMFISSSGGFVFETAMRSYKQMALFQPVINGVGGNLAAVHSSRISTFLHRTSIIGILPEGWHFTKFFNIKRAFFSSDWDARSARVLLFLVVPGHILFNWLIGILHTGENPPSSALFTSLYLLAALSQVAILLFVCQLLVANLWQRQIDPDNAAIPYLTAIGDLVGTLFLYLAFSFLSFVKHKEIIKT